tara:strand:+ start:1388 stop:2344 length:957 start_codon:yes stop_codon:yes gene_type:complete
MNNYIEKSNYIETNNIETSDIETNDIETNDIETSNKPRIITTSNWLHNFIITLEVSNPLANWDNLIELYQNEKKNKLHMLISYEWLTHYYNDIYCDKTPIEDLIDKYLLWKEEDLLWDLEEKEPGINSDIADKLINNYIERHIADIKLNKSKLISQYRNDKKTGLTNLFQKIPKPQLRIVITDEQMVDKLIYIGIDNNINWRQHYLIKFNSNEEQNIIMELYINKDGGRYIFEQGERRFDNSRSDFSIPLINNADNADNANTDNANNANTDNDDTENNVDTLNQTYSIVKTLKYFAIKKCTKLRKLRNVYIPTYENTF